MNRADLVAKLECCAPALSGNELLPILTHFWFDGKTVLAFNDQIAISAPMKADFEGAVPGKTLLELLKASRAKDVEFVLGKDDDQLIVKAASSKFKLGTRPVADFCFDMPKSQDKGVLSVDAKRFLAAVESCMRSVSIDTSVPDQLGITLIPNGKELSLFATDDRTLSYAVVPMKAAGTFKGRCILSAHFCRQLLKLAEPSKPMHLEITDEYAMHIGASGIVLWGKLVHSEKPIPYARVLEKNYPESYESKLVNIPTKLELILDRACIVSAAGIEQVRMDINVEKGVAHFSTKAKSNEVHDTLQLEGKHSDVSIKLEAKLVKNGYGAFDKMLVTPESFIMASDGLVYLVGASGT